MKVLILLIILFGQNIFAQKVYSPFSTRLSVKIIQKADSCLNLKPITVTSSSCTRSAGGKHDFYSEGDYWWPDPANPDGPYIQRDGQTNPENFLEHRRAMVRFSKIVGLLASAYILNPKEKYLIAANEHYKAWFKDTLTRMNPSLLYAQAIKGRFTGRGIGVIDMIQMMEVAQSLMVFEKTGKLSSSNLISYKSWFSEYLYWVNNHKYGIDEREAKNNHGTCWVMQVAVFAKFVGNTQMMEYCKDRFKNVLLPNQLAEDGSFPLEMARTKPYGYALFNLDAMCTISHVLSDKRENLFEYTLPKGQNLKKAIEYMYPFVEDKSRWTLKPDVMYWNEWPVAHPFLYFYSQKTREKKFLDLWSKFEHFPRTEEVIRNLPVRNPLIWE